MNMDWVFKADNKPIMTNAHTGSSLVCVGVGAPAFLSNQANKICWACSCSALSLAKKGKAQ